MIKEEQDNDWRWSQMEWHRAQADLCRGQPDWRRWHLNQARWFRSHIPNKLLKLLRGPKPS